MSYKKINKCRICGNKDLIELIDLGKQTMTGIFPKNPNEKHTIGPLKLVKCNTNKGNCGLVQLGHNYNLDEMYGETYGYRSGLNLSMVNHLSNKAHKIESLANLKDNDIIIDIGSNDATLLKSYKNSKLSCFGCDPSAGKFKSFYTDNIELVTEFFPSKTLHNKLNGKKAKIITSIAMFYDLEYPLEFVKAVYDILDIDGVWVFEQSYLPMMVKSKSYDTICHEHLEYYCLKQIKWMTEKVGFKIIDVEFNKINGGSFSVTVSKKESKIFKENTKKIKEIEKLEKEQRWDHIGIYKYFNDSISKNRTEIMNFLNDCLKKGKKVYGYGASTKGNVLLQYCNINSKLINAIAEVNEDKFGSFTPGTNIPILSEKEVREKQPDFLFVLPWHFRNNILKKEAEYIKNTGVKFVFPLPNLEIV